MNSKSIGMWCGLVGLLAAGGCGGGKMLPVEENFSLIVVGQSNAGEVLEVLPEGGMLQTANSVTILRDDKWRKELGLVTFNEEDSVVRRKDYLQRRSFNWTLMTEEVLRLEVETVVPQEVLEVPYETEMRKQAAILRYCHEAMIEDMKPFLEDKQTESQVGLGRTALGMGILSLDERPREAALLTGAKGFGYRHPVLGKCRLWLRQEHENVYSVKLEARDWVDPFMLW